MKVELFHKPAYTLAVARLEPEERICAEAGAMVSMSGDVAIDTRAEGGLLKSLGRAVLGGESFFQNFFQAGSGGGEVTFAPDLPGDIAVVELTGASMLVQAGSFLACEIGVELNTRLSGRSFMAGEGLTALEATGSGKLLVSSYGAIFEKTLGPGESYVVDSSHLVAFDGSLTIAPRTVGGLKSTLLSGEGLVIDLSGPGRLLIQTRSPQALLNWIIPQLPKTPRT